MIHITKITSAGAIHISLIDTLFSYDECWIYTGPAHWDDGYPIINRFKKNWIVSRLMWFLFTGRDYYKREIHHTCKTRQCGNPTHLEELTAKKHRRSHEHSSKRRKKK